MTKKELSDKIRAHKLKYGLRLASRQVNVHRWTIQRAIDTPEKVKIETLELIVEKIEGIK